MNNSLKNLAIWLMIGLILMALFNVFQGPAQTGQSSVIPYSDFLAAVESGEVVEAEIRQGDSRISRVIARLNTEKTIETNAPEDANLMKTLRDKGVRVSAKSDEGRISLLSIFLSLLPMLIFIGIWIFFMRQMQSGGGKAMGFGKSRARTLQEIRGKVTFDDVAGVNEAKEELEEVVEFLKDPHKFQRLGGQIPKGALLVGPPGTGKTLLARAVAGEANVPFFFISGSDFVEMFVGVGASRVRDLFEQGKKNAPCIIFIDEIDAVGRHRGAGLGGGNDEREQTLNQLLVEMDGFETNEGVILIAATNRPDVLDPALLRPGRFDRQVVVPNPDIQGREAILKVHMKKTPLDEDVDAKVIARGTPGFSGADLKNLVNEAALLAARQNKNKVTMADFESAKDKLMMGTERRTLVMSEEEKRLTAYHEGGHAVVAFHSPNSDPIHKATIIPRGRALGMVMRLPETDRTSMSRAKLKADLAVAMGGRIAEELIFGHEKVTTGASSDIKMATTMARRMVTEWGMSEKLGPLSYGEPQQEVFLGHSVTQSAGMSEKTASIVDQEVRLIVDDAYNSAKALLTKHKDQLDLLANALLEYETLSGDEIRELFMNKKLAKEKPVPPVAKPKRSSATPGAKRAGSVPQSGARATKTKSDQNPGDETPPELL